MSYIKAYLAEAQDAATIEAAKMGWCALMDGQSWPFVKADTARAALDPQGLTEIYEALEIFISHVLESSYADLMPAAELGARWFQEIHDSTGFEKTLMSHTALSEMCGDVETDMPFVTQNGDVFVGICH
jgi:hypothetical protein